MTVYVYMIFVCYILQSRFMFNNNKITSENGQGQSIFAVNIATCVLPQRTTENTTSSVFQSSVFAVSNIFDFT